MDIHPAEEEHFMTRNILALFSAVALACIAVCADADAAGQNEAGGFDHAQEMHVQTFALVRDMSGADDLDVIIDWYGLDLIGDMPADGAAALILPIFYPMLLELFEADEDDAGNPVIRGDLKTKHLLNDGEVFLMPLEYAETMPKQAVRLTDMDSKMQRIWFPLRSGKDDSLPLDPGFVAFTLPVPEPIADSPLSRRDLSLIQENLLRLWDLGISALDGPPDNAFVVENTLRALMLENSGSAGERRNIFIEKGQLDQAAQQFLGYSVSEHFAPEGFTLAGDRYFADMNAIRAGNEYWPSELGDIRYHRLAKVTETATEESGALLLSGRLRRYKTKPDGDVTLWNESDFTLRIAKDGDTDNWRIIGFSATSNPMG